jgi:uncharacterized protein
VGGGSVGGVGLAERPGSEKDDPMLRCLLSAFAFMALCQPVWATCTGENALNALPQADRAALQARTDAAPFAQGNFWRATRGDAAITIIGTYHLGDPRHAATLAAISGLIGQATTVLVEAGPAEERQLMASMAQNPSGMLITTGPSLMEQLPADDWARLTKAMADRQIPAFMAAKFQPWYISILLSVPPCAMAAMAEKGGLDFSVIAMAEAEQVPLLALEPFDTVLKLFDGMPAQTQIEMVQTALVMEAEAANNSITLADAYFAENSRVVWELMQDQALTLPGYTPERVTTEFAALEEAAADGPAFAAFGALHLSGDEGVLNLLAGQGWTVERLPLR